MSKQPELKQLSRLGMGSREDGYERAKLPEARSAFTTAERADANPAPGTLAQIFAVRPPAVLTFTSRTYSPPMIASHGP